MPEQVGPTVKSTWTRKTPLRPIMGSARQTGRAHLQVVPGDGVRKNGDGRGYYPSLACYNLFLRNWPSAQHWRVICWKEKALGGLPGESCWKQWFLQKAPEGGA